MTQDNQNCLGCGSSIPKSAIKCGFCGFDITRKELSGGSYIEKLQQQLFDLETQFAQANQNLSAKQVLVGAGDPAGSKLTAAKVSTISTFSLPNDKEQLLELFYFSDNNYDSFLASAKSPYWTGIKSIDEQQNDKLANAWAGKAKMAYNKLKRFVNEDDEIKALVEEYKNKYHVDASKMQQSSINNNQGNGIRSNGKAVLFGLNQSGVILGVVLLLLCFPLCWLPLVMPQFKGE